MPDETRYIVSILEPVGGKLGWRTLLNTKDLEEANALIAAMEADNVKARYEVILPRRKREIGARRPDKSRPSRG